MEIIIVVTPCQPEPLPKRWAAVFEAKVDDRVICRSRQPFVDGARVLLGKGCDPELVLVMRHGNSGVDALMAKLSTAAKWTVFEGVTRLTKWAPHPGRGFFDKNAGGQVDQGPPL